MKRAHNAINMSGQHYNNWKVISYYKTVKKMVYYNCVCLLCNESYIVNGKNIRTEKSKQCFKCGKKIEVKNRIGKERSRTPIEERKAMYLTKSIKRGAAKRNIKFEINHIEVWELSQKNCKYCNLPPLREVNVFNGMDLSHKTIKLGNIKYNGLDRVDSSKSYTLDNVVPCCYTCNKAKSSLTLQEFEEWIVRVHTVLMEKNIK